LQINTQSLSVAEIKAAVKKLKKTNNIAPELFKADFTTTVGILAPILSETWNTNSISETRIDYYDPKEG